jgi:hypothetical protein
MLGLIKLTAAVIIHPRSDLCMNGDCPNVVPLKKETQQKAVVYTQDIGVQPAWYIHVYCPSTFRSQLSNLNPHKAVIACKTSYHNNYSVCDGTRTYYAGVPTYLQVGEHQFVEHTLAKVWRGQMLLGW